MEWRAGFTKVAHCAGSKQLIKMRKWGCAQDNSVNFFFLVLVFPFFRSLVWMLSF